MNKCVFIICVGKLSNEDLQEFLKKEARKNRIEGTVHSEDGSIRIIINGSKESIDQFIDALYSNSAKYDLSDIEVEPFYKHKDFRGVFRIIQ